MKPGRQVPAGFFVALIGIIAFILLGALAFIAPARAAGPIQPPAPGATCTNLTARYSARDAIKTAERVRVLELAALPSGRPGAWVMPVAGPLAWGQFQVPVDELTECEL